MKRLITSVLAVLLAAGTTIKAQKYPDEYLGLPGDNLNLYAVMKLFQESETLEGFERTLNDEKSNINNLDLNGDDMVDYITVTDYVDGNVHNIVLRALVNRDEFQDVAVFTVQRFQNGSVEIQLVGDEDLYGKNYIIEPIYDTSGDTPNPGYTGARTNVTVVRTTAYEVAAWPVVRFIYLPNYVIWNSSWYWGYYPPYWRPWRPFFWHYYYGYHYHWYHYYYGHYHHWNHFRYTHYNDFYYGRVRAHSPYVSQRIREGSYRTTYSRPEQRREGEALYAKIHPDQPRRSENITTNQERRTTSRPEQVRTVNGNVRHPENTRSERTKNPGTERRATPAEPNSQNTKSERAQNPATQRRTTPVVSGRQTSGPESREKAQTSRPSRQSAPSAQSKSSRSSGEKKSGTSSGSRSKSSDKSSDSRRK